MSDSSSEPNVVVEDGFRLGDWLVEPQNGTLARNGIEHHLEPKAMEVLIYLADNAQRSVRRETLLKQVWPDTFGTDEVLSRVISILRNRLGDDPRSPTYIETLPKVGYRLLLPVLPLHVAIDKVPYRKHFWIGGVFVLAMLLLLSLLMNQMPGNLSNGAGSTGSVWLAELLEETRQTEATLAVLPFEDLSGVEDNRFFADGLTDELITSLSRREGLRVVARRSITNLQGAGFGRMPDVTHVLDGAVKFTRDGIRVTAQLSDKKGFVIWSNDFQGVREDFVQLQLELTADIVSQLDEQLGSSPTKSPDSSPPKTNMDAYYAYLNGRFLWKLRGEEALRASIQAFEAALQQDPGMIEAHLALASSHVLLPYYSADTEADSFQHALTEIKTITTAQPRDKRQLAEIAAIQGFIAFREWRWVAADKHFQESFSEDASLANTWVWYSQFLSAVGRAGDALLAARKGYELDAVSPVVIDRLATAYLWVNEDQKADALYRQGASLGFANRINPGFLNLLLRQQRWEEASRVIAAFNQGDGLAWIQENLAGLADPSRQAEFVTVTHSAIQTGQLQPRLELGWWTHIGEPAEALKTIDKYQENKKHIDVEFLFSNEAISLRSLPEFQPLMINMGLARYWDMVDRPDFQK